MAVYELDPDDEEYLEDCPLCGEGYMVPTYGHWYECNNCGVEAEENEYGLLMFDADIDFI